MTALYLMRRMQQSSLPVRQTGRGQKIEHSALDSHSWVWVDDKDSSRSQAGSILRLREHAFILISVVVRCYQNKPLPRL